MTGVWQKKPYRQPYAADYSSVCGSTIGRDRRERRKHFTGRNYYQIVVFQSKYGWSSFNMSTYF